MKYYGFIAVSLFVLGVLASSIGCMLGWFAQEALFQLLRGLLPQHVASPGLLAVFFGFIIGMAVLLGFALPPLLRLKPSVSVTSIAPRTGAITQ